jgi:ABC-2 type transport system permease protein
MRELTWTPFFALFNREITRFMKVIVQTVITPFVNATLYLMIFGVSLGEQIKLENGLNYMAFLIPGLVMMACLNNSFQNTSSSIISSKFSGDLEDLKVAPFGAAQIIWALNLAALVRGLMVGSINFFIGELCYRYMYGEWLAISHPLHLLFFLFVGSLAFANMGIMVAFWARTFDQLSAVTGFILQPLLYLGGVFFSVHSLPSLWQTISLWNPLLYIINGVRFGILGTADVHPYMAMGVTLATFVAMQIAAVRSLKRGSFQRW